MKRTLLFLIAALLTSAGWAQDTSLDHDPIPSAEVPALVLKSQETNFPDGFVREWYVDRGLTATDAIPERYMSKFSDNGSTNNSYATYLPNGMLFFQSEFLAPDRIPSEIVLKTRADFDAYQIQHADFITLNNPKRQIYRVHIRDEALAQTVYYTIDGVEIPKNRLPEALLVFKY